MGRRKETVTLTLPFAPPAGRGRERLDFHLTPRQAFALRALWEKREHYVFWNRRREPKMVVSAPDVIRALLDAVAERVIKEG